MHIGMIHFSGGKFPPDIRIEKEISALLQAGMRVSILCKRTSEDEPEEEAYRSHATIYRPRITRTRALRRFVDRRSALTILYPYPRSMLVEYMERANPDVLHVHDLPMVPTALATARTRGLPVVADLHENYPAAVFAWRSDQPWYRPVLAGLRAIHRVHENRCSMRCARIIVTVPEAAERFLRRGIPVERILVVSNTEDETTMPWPLPGIDAAMAAEFAGKWVAAFVGGTGAHRGLDIAIRGVPTIAKAVPNFRLLIVGATKGQAEKLGSLAQRCRVERHVDIRLWQPFERCVQYDLIAQVGLVPFRDTEHTQTTVPHKLFQYMVCRRPVVVSDCAPLKRIVEETESGEVFRANDPEDFARAIILLARDAERCRRYATNGQKAALGRYAWRHDAARLVAMYARLTGGLDGGSGEPSPAGLSGRSEPLA